MNRRGFFGAVTALGAVLTIGRKPEIRFIEFNRQREDSGIYAIYWSTGHRPIDDFVSSRQQIGLLIAPEQVRHGYATRKLAFDGMYLSDTPQENFDPITYWIPADHISQEVTA